MTGGETRTVSVPNAVLLPEVIRMVEQGHSVTIPLRGYSMRPFLEHERDKALLVAPGEVKVGDVALAEVEEKRYVMHRIVAIDGEDVTLRGDGNLSDEHCKAGDIKAVAVAFFRKGRQEADRVDGRKWKTYSWWWTRLYPIRRYLLFLYRRYRAIVIKY